MAALRAIGLLALLVGGLLVAVPRAHAVAPLDYAAALQADATRIAADNQWPVAATVTFLENQASFEELVAEIMDDYPASFSAAVNAPAPGYPATLYFKGSVPPGAQALITASGLSVNVLSGASKSHLEMQAHADAVADFLEGEGYESFVVSYDDFGTVEVTIGNGEPQPALPAPIAQGVVFELISGPAEDEQVSRGGARTTPPGSGWCTSGFSVRRITTGVTGVTTAEHCGVLALLDNRNGDTETLTFQAGHRGAFGDVAWFTTRGADVPEIWWRPGTAPDDRRIIQGARDVTARGTRLCFFGETNGRNCDEVRRVSVWTWRQRRLVQMKDRKTEGGDSGGPWFDLNRAIGVHHGLAWAYGWRSVFSRAVRLPDALGVEVLP
jgi:streptogrisin C